MCHDIMKHKTTFTSRVEELGKQLQLPTEQIRAIQKTTKHSTEHLSFSLGPPHYSGSYYGSVSIKDFNILKKQRSTTHSNK